MRVAALVVGVILTAWTVLSMFTSMLVPHARPSGISRGVRAFVWRVMRAPLRLMRSYAAQDRWLAAAAPIAVILQLAVYATILILTLGLIVYGTTTMSLGDSVYQAGATFTTLGIVEPVNDPSTVVTFVAAFLGLVVIAVFIGYLFGTYSAYAARESAMARFSMIAGEPAWGTQVLARGAILGMPDDQVLDASYWIDWITAVRVNHQVNVTLADFRSVSPLRHWVTTMLAVMDAAAMRLARGDRDPLLVQVLAQGAETYAVLRPDADGKRIPNWTLETQILAIIAEPPATSPSCSLTRSEWDNAMSELEAAALQAPADPELTWRRFSALRGLYEGNAYLHARRHHAVPAPWSGPRDPALAVQWPESAGGSVKR